MLKKSFCLLAVFVATVIVVSCANDTKKISSSFVVIPDVPTTNYVTNYVTNVYYNLHTPSITVDGVTSSVWEVESREFSKVYKIWTNMMNQDVYTAYSHDREATGNKGAERGKVDKSTLNINLDNNLAKTFKRAVIVQVPITEPNAQGTIQGKYTVAGVYEVSKTVTPALQSVGYEEAIISRFDTEYQNGLTYWRAQILYTPNENVKANDSDILYHSFSTFNTPADFVFMKK